MATCESHGHLRGVGDKCMMCGTAMELPRLSGAQMIDNERTRQITSEGWDARHDDEHIMGEMIGASITYAAHALGIVSNDEVPCADGGSFWPWDDDQFKPSPDPIRNLVKAGALIAAEIDRLQRRGARRDGGDNIFDAQDKGRTLSLCGSITCLIFVRRSSRFSSTRLVLRFWEGSSILLLLAPSDLLLFTRNVATKDGELC